MPAALAATTAPSSLQATGVSYTSIALSWSPATVSTPADVQAPTSPGNLVDNDPQPESGAFELYWNRSSDNATTLLSYEVYANGELVQVVSGIGAGVTVCLDPGSYTFTVRAHDAAGNLSAPSNTTQ